MHNHLASPFTAVIEKKDIRNTYCAQTFGRIAKYCTSHVRRNGVVEKKEVVHLPLSFLIIAAQWMLAFGR